MHKEFGIICKTFLLGIRFPDNLIRYKSVAFHWYKPRFNNNIRQFSHWIQATTQGRSNNPRLSEQIGTHSVFNGWVGRNTLYIHIQSQQLRKSV